jgi:hypothetical protein
MLDIVSTYVGKVLVHFQVLLTLVHSKICRTIVGGEHKRHRFHGRKG